MIDGVNTVDIPRFDVNEMVFGEYPKLHTEVADEGVGANILLLVEPSRDDFLFAGHFIDTGLVTEENLFGIQ